MRARIIIFAIVILIIGSISVSAVEDLIAYQGKVTSAGSLVNNGNLTVEIWDAATGGNLVYNSSEDFNGSIKNGFYNVVLGSVTELNLNFSSIYYMDVAINGEDIDWDPDERMMFQSPVGNEVAKNFTFYNNVTIRGTLLGGSPLKVGGGLNITSGDLIFPDGTTQSSASSGGDSPWNNDTNEIFVSAGYPDYINASGTLFVNGSSGNVGIGTTSPSSKLTFAESTAAAGGILFGSDINLYRSAGGGTPESQGPNNPGTAADNDGIGTESWSNVNNVFSNNGADASTFSNQAGLLISHYLVATNFGFSIPTGSIIAGILVEIEKDESSSGDNIRDHKIRIVKDGTITGDDKASGTEWPTSEGYRSHGGATDLWGVDWTPDDINDTGFGVAVSANGTGTTMTALIDHIRITVYYNNASLVTDGDFSVGGSLSVSGGEVLAADEIKQMMVFSGDGACNADDIWLGIGLMRNNLKGAETTLVLNITASEMYCIYETADADSVAEFAFLDDGVVTAFNCSTAPGGEECSVTGQSVVIEKLSRIAIALEEVVTSISGRCSCSVLYTVQH